MLILVLFGDYVKIAKLTYTIIDPFILQAWVSLHTVKKSTNLKSHQQRFRSKLPNTMFVYIFCLYSISSRLLTFSVSDGTKMVGISKPALFSPGLLHSSCVICISTFCSDEVMLITVLSVSYHPLLGYTANTYYNMYTMYVHTHTHTHTCT